MSQSGSVETYRNHLGYELRYQLHLPEGITPGERPLRTLAYCGGYGSDMDSEPVTCSMTEVLRNNIAVVRFDTTPVLWSKNNLTIKTVDTSMLKPSYYARTVHAALKHTIKEYGDGKHPIVDKNNISLNAFSFGGLGGLYYTAHMNGLEKSKRVLDEAPVPIKGLNLLSPFTTMEMFWLEILLGKHEWKKNGVVNVPIAGYNQDVPYELYEELRTLNLFKDVAPHVTCPVNIVYGSEDKLVTAKHMALLYKNLTRASYKEIHEISHAGHVFEDTQKLAALSKKKDWMSLVKTAQPGDKKKTLLARYILENFRDVTKVDEVIQLSKDFLLNKVFVPENNPINMHALTAA